MAYPFVHFYFFFRGGVQHPAAVLAGVLAHTAVHEPRRVGRGLGRAEDPVRSVPSLWRTQGLLIMFRSYSRCSQFCSSFILSDDRISLSWCISSFISLSFINYPRQSVFCYSRGPTRSLALSSLAPPSIRSPHLHRHPRHHHPIHPPTPPLRSQPRQWTRVCHSQLKN